MDSEIEYIVMSFRSPVVIAVGSQYGGVDLHSDRDHESLRDLGVARGSQNDHDEGRR